MNISRVDLQASHSQRRSQERNLYFLNHQNWQISYHADPQNASIAFQLKDPFGCVSTTSLFILENLETGFIQELNFANKDQQQELIRNYVEKCFKRYSPYQIHVEKYKDQLVVRFGDYGLKGGGKETAMLFSAAQVVVGIGFCTTGGGVVFGSTLISSGLSGGMNAYNQEWNKDFDYSDYAKKSIYGAVSGLITGGASHVAQGADFSGRVLVQMIGGAAGSVASTTTSSLVEKGEVPSAEEIAGKVVVGAVGNAAGALGAAACGNVLGEAAVEAEVITRILKGAVQGSAASTASTISTNLIEGEDPTQNLGVSIVLGGALGGTMAGLTKNDVWVKRVEKPGEWGPQPPEGQPLKRPIPLPIEDPPKRHPFSVPRNEEVKRLLERLEIKQASVIRASVNRGIFTVDPMVTVREILKSKPIVNYDPDVDELSSHVVLVHALHQDNIIPNEGDDLIQWAESSSPEEKAGLSFKKAVLPNGVLGSHLQLERQVFRGDALQDRVQLHWSWNQLVQPNSGGNWEGSRIAILEPLSTFESSDDKKPFGVAPYDTLTFGSHRLSKDSIILVPDSIIHNVKGYLTGFLGKMVPYDASLPLRLAIDNALKSHYPQVWPMCDENGNLTGSTARFSGTGFTSKTCLRKPNGEVMILLQNEGRRQEDQTSTAMRRYANSRRYIGLHIHSRTFMIEDGNNAYFTALKAFKSNNTSVINHNSFAGSIQNAEEVNRLGILEVHERMYSDLLENYDPSTGARSVAEYIMKEALHADLVSLFYKSNPSTAHFLLSPFDLKMTIEENLNMFCRHLERIRKAENPDEKKRLFDTYCIKHETLLQIITLVKEEIHKFKFGLERIDVHGELPKCLRIGEKQWSQIPTPSNINCNLENEWPPEEPLLSFVNEVLGALPEAEDQLKNLYQQLKSLPFTTERSQYKLNLVSNLIEMVLGLTMYQSLKSTLI